MNQLNERLAIIRRQKSIYHKQADECEKQNDMDGLYRISRKIQDLDKEESDLLKQIKRGAL